MVKISKNLEGFLVFVGFLETLGGVKGTLTVPGREDSTKPKKHCVFVFFGFLGLRIAKVTKNSVVVCFLFFLDFQESPENQQNQKNIKKQMVVGDCCNPQT